MSNRVGERDSLPAYKGTSLSFVMNQHIKLGIANGKTPPAKYHNSPLRYLKVSVTANEGWPTPQGSFHSGRLPTGPANPS